MGLPPDFPHQSPFWYTTCLVHHARPFVGVFQSLFLPGLSTFDNNSHQNGSKNGETAPRPGTGYPHEGPSVGQQPSTLLNLICFLNIPTLDSTMLFLSLPLCPLPREGASENRGTGSDLNPQKVACGGTSVTQVTVEHIASDLSLKLTEVPRLL